MPAQDHVVRCVIPDGSPLDPWFVNWSLWQAGENPEPEKRARIHAASGIRLSGGRSTVHWQQWRPFRDLVNGKHAAYRC